MRKRWEIVAVWPDGDLTPAVSRPRFWTEAGARRFLDFAQEACDLRARRRGIAPPRLEVQRRG